VSISSVKRKHQNWNSIRRYGGLEMRGKTTKRLTITFPEDDVDRCKEIVKARGEVGIRTTTGSLIRLALHRFLSEWDPDNPSGL